MPDASNLLKKKKFYVILTLSAAKSILFIAIIQIKFYIISLLGIGDKHE